MVHRRDEGPRGRVLRVAEPRRDAELPAGSLHAERARRDGASLGGGTAAGPGAAVHGGGEADGSIDDDRDARGAVAPARGRRLRVGSAPYEEARGRRLTVAVPAKGRLREPSVGLLD